MKKNPIRAVFLDYDGTIYSHASGQIPDTTIEAIRSLQSKGIKVFLCSGRVPQEMKAFDLSGIRFDGQIYANGQLIFDEKKEIIYQGELDKEVREKLVEVFENKRLPVLLVRPEGLLINYVDDHVKKVQQAISTAIPPVGTYEGGSFYMAAVFCKDPDDPLINELKQLAEVTFWHEGACDIVPRNISKATGMEMVMKRHGIGREETLAVGDGDNDIEMLEYAGIGIAMGNSPDFVKKRADHVTGTIDENGLAEALHYYELI